MPKTPLQTTRRNTFTRLALALLCLAAFVMAAISFISPGFGLALMIILPASIAMEYRRPLAEMLPTYGAMLLGLCLGSGGNMVQSTFYVMPAGILV